MDDAAGRPRRPLARIAAITLGVAVLLLLAAAACAPALRPPLTLDDVPLHAESGCADWRAAPPSARAAFVAGAAERWLDRRRRFGLAHEEVPDAVRIRSWLDAECAHGDRWLGHVVIDLMAEVLTRG
jgi:hypothetical protein